MLDDTEMWASLFSQLSNRISCSYTSRFSSWKDTQDPAACNTNPDVYKKFSRDPERTPFQWDGTTNAGFSSAPKTWLPVNPNYVGLNLQAQKTAAKSHFKFYQKLMSLRKLETFQYGDFKVLALNKQVFALVRDLVDKETYVVVINIGANNEQVNLKAFATLHDKLKVVAAAPASDYQEGWVISCLIMSKQKLDLHVWLMLALLLNLKPATANIYSAIINSYQMTLGKFDAVVLMDDNRSRSLATKHAVNVTIFALMIACLFAFN